MENHATAEVKNCQLFVFFRSFPVRFEVSMSLDPLLKKIKELFSATSNLVVTTRMVVDSCRMVFCPQRDF